MTQLLSRNFLYQAVITFKLNRYTKFSLVYLSELSQLAFVKHVHYFLEKQMLRYVAGFHEVIFFYFLLKFSMPGVYI